MKLKFKTLRKRLSHAVGCDGSLSVSTRDLGGVWRGRWICLVNRVADFGKCVLSAHKQSISFSGLLNKFNLHILLIKIVNIFAVKIDFEDKKFEKLANDDRKLDREFGKVRADKIRARLAQLRAADTLEDVRYLPGNYHELKANRKGQWACDLDQPYRLLFTPQERPIPINKDGQYSWVRIMGVGIIEVINYHKEG